MPRNGSGTFTLVSGNPVVTGTTIESNWANTTLSDIATAMTDSLSRSGQGGMTAALRIADGSQGAPGVGFANETGSGFYRAGTGEVWAVVQGAQTLNLDANGVYVPADKTTTVDGAFVFNEAGADKDARFEGDTDANLLFTDASTDRVGIGTATPASKLDVVGDVTVSGAVNAATVNATTLDLTNIEVTNIKAKDGTAAATIADATGVVNFAANVGVGASTPTFGSGSGVEIERAGIATLRLENSSASNSFELYADTAANGINLRGRDSSPMNFWTGNTLQMKLDSSGNLGLGVTPSAWTTYNVLQVGKAALTHNNNNTYLGANWFYDGANKYIATDHALLYAMENGQHIWLTAPSGTAGNAISFTQAMTLDASGNLGLGTTAPSGAAGLAFAINGGGNQTRIALKNSTTGDAAGDGFQILLDGGGVDAAIENRENGHIRFSTNSTERARITSGGDFLVNTTGAGGKVYVVSDLTANNGLRVDVPASFTSNSIALISATAAGSGWNFLYGESSGGSSRITIRGDGNVYNANGTYGTISDARLKQDIVDAGSQWADIKAIRFRKYRMKSDVDVDPNAPVLLGVVAQELEQVCPGLVDDGETKSVKSSVLLMKAAVALQEAMTRIEQLEARVAALEAQP